VTYAVAGPDAVTGVTIGLLHPGEMGAAIGSVLRERGHTILWASSGRSAATARRADGSGLVDVGLADELVARSDVLVSVCPPHAAAEVADSVAGYAGVYLDANAISPASSRAIATVIEDAGGRYVDGGIVGPPPRSRDTTRIYLSGASAAFAADLFDGSVVKAVVVSEHVGQASGVKMAYAAWTKGTAALLLAIRELARTEGVEPTLLGEWRLSLPELEEASDRAAGAASRKGWRWVAEMEEIAATFAAADLPDGFHRAAAEVFRRAENDRPTTPR
jgi:3-hydroxyisobutyrate dehydrogenase-like beta-hydroxyacid dehydrogenase